MNKLLRLVGTAVLVLVVIRVVSWLLSPALPVLVEILVIALIFYVSVNGWRRL
ncbi:MAG: hypothetical protein M0Z69_16760 [Actinomycetota bacterium]|nr:hypothetical protein [Actinomycetota bacterium]